MLPTRRVKLAWITGGVLIIVAIAVAIATYLVLRDDGTPAPSPSPASPEVTVAEGSLRGEWVSLPEHDIRYAAFRGIPYASPPVGPLRFKAPLPAASWFGVRDATKEGSECLQQDIFMNNNLTGSEDCLYLNVYTPREQGSNELLPVYFFIHGGSFIFGSGTSAIYGPDFFMLKNVVVVTINYRLNAFGFLNLDNDVVPGNAGIKDQIAALQWVHSNIGHFGGDQDLITIGGQSAGAASAHWLTLLPEPRALVHRVILESGSALQSWAYNEDHLDVALDLGARLKGEAVSLDEVAPLLMSASAMDILTHAVDLATFRMSTNATQIPFATTPERRTPHSGGQIPLITQDPEKYILTDDKAVPMFLGMNSREWLYSFYYYGYASRPEYMKYRLANLVTVFPKSVMPYSDTAFYIKKINTLYLQQAVDAAHLKFFQNFSPDCDEACVFKLYLDDVVIGIDINRLAELRARNGNSQTYVYRFAVRANYSTSALVDPAQATGGAVHSDELGYLWKMTGLNQRLVGDGLASDTLRRMVNLWTSYIKSGTPDPGEEKHREWQTNEHHGKTGDTIFLNIAENLEVRKRPIAGPNTEFWYDLFQKYRDYKTT